MKSTGNNTAGTGLWTSPNTGADNTSGFTALPGGYRDINGSFSSISSRALFWSATEDGVNAIYRRLSNNNGSVLRVIASGTKSIGASVRCLRD